MRETELFFRCVRQNYFLAYKSSIVLSEFQDYTFRQPLQVYPKLMMVKFTSSLPMHYNLQVYGLISQNGFFYSNDASSPRNLGFKFQFNRSNNLDTCRDSIYTCLYILLCKLLNYRFIYFH